MTPSNANTSGLAPCPFCGGAPFDRGFRRWECGSCGAQGPAGSKADATSGWNRRATAAEARADRLAKALMTARDYVSDAAEGHAWTASQVAELMRGNRPDNRQAGDDLASIDTALQQETQK